MPRPRPRPRLTRLSSSSLSSSSLRKANPKIYTFVIAGGILLLASVAFLQVRLGRAPHGSQLDPLENDNSDEDFASGQASWWGADRSAKGDGSETDLDFGRLKHGKASRRRGALEREGDTKGVDNAEQEAGGEELETGDELEDEEEGERFDAELDDREMEVDNDDMEDFEFGDVGEKLREVSGFIKQGREFQGEVLDEIDKFEKGQVLQDMGKLGNMEGLVIDKGSGKTGSSEDGGRAVEREGERSGQEEDQWLKRENLVSSKEKGDVSMLGLESQKDQAPNNVGTGKDKAQPVRVELGKEDSAEGESRGSTRTRDQKRGSVDDSERGWKVLEKLGSVAKQDSGKRDRVRSRLGTESMGFSDTLEGAIRGDLEGELQKNKGLFLWDQALGVRKMALEKVENGGSDKSDSNIVLTDPDVTNVKLLGVGEEVAAKSAMHQLRGFKEFVETLKEQYNTDDEPLDEDVQRQLEELVEIEDALLLNGEGASFKSLAKTPTGKAGHQQKKGRRVFNPVNPANIPMLQDPDTSPGSWMTKSDKAILRAMRADGYGSDHRSPSGHLRGRKELSSTEKDGIRQPGTLQQLLSSLETEQKSSQPRKVSMKGSSKERTDRSAGFFIEEKSSGGLDGEHAGGLKSRGLRGSYKDTKAGNAHIMSVVDEKLEVFKTSSENLTGDLEWVASSGQTSQVLLISAKQSSTEAQNEDFRTFPEDTSNGSQTLDAEGKRQWGQFPGISPSVSFSKFMVEFLYQEGCTLRVFMAWTTPPWSFTVRHQRALESLLHFHPHACVVVFSESIESNFFETFVQEGYKVAVVMPNLEELLADTPADVFASVWLKWRRLKLFYIHYTELLRLAALYKYGGLYLDMDMIVLKPLDTLHNMVGSEFTGEGELQLNGAVMSVSEECLAEFTATYDAELLQWNGAGLLTRVANSTLNERGEKWPDVPDMLQIQPPFAFFPLDKTNISRYLKGPVETHQQQEQGELLTKILEESYTAHLWNGLTAQLVPEAGSVVETILNRCCVRCTDVL